MNKLLIALMTAAFAIGTAVAADAPKKEEPKAAVADPCKDAKDPKACKEANEKAAAAAKKDAPKKVKGGC